MNKVLERQLKKAFGKEENAPKGLETFLALISDTYDHAEEDRLLVERSFDLNSKEMTALNDKLKKESEALKSRTQEAEDSKVAVLNLLQDIEEEKKKVDELVVVRTKELSDERARLLASINSISFGFIIVDDKNVVLLKNPALNTILGLNEEPKTLADVAKKLTGIDLVSSCQASITTNTVVELKEVEYGKKFIRVFCAPVSEGSQTIGNVVIIEDITEAKVLERSRDEFFAVASHELRTPLTAIRGNADMMLEMYADKIIDNDMKEMLVDINTSSVRLIGIVNDFLEVSRLEQGRIEMKKEKFDPCEVIEKVLRDLKGVIAKKGVVLAYAQEKCELPAVMADRDRVEQVLVNLVGNAAKFTKKGSITVSSEFTPTHVKIRVADTGIGISPHGQTLLFRKFQQAGDDALTRDITQGTGLGLYISGLLVANMGGEIKLEKSEVGVGSTFFFTVPLAL